MRILYHHRTLADGAEGIHIKEMIAAFRSLGHEVCVVALAGENTAVKPTRQRQWSAVSRVIPNCVYEFAEIGYNVVGRRAVNRAINRFSPDVIYDRYNSYCTAAVGAGRKSGIPVLLEVNAPVAFERTAYEKLQLKFPKLAVSYERRICNSADHIFAVSTPLKTFLVEERGVDSEAITVLPNGANPDYFGVAGNREIVRDSLGIPADRTTIGFVGILRPWHGVEMLLSVFERLIRTQANVHLLLVGDGPMENDLKRAAKNLGVLERVSFTGRIPHDRIRDYISAIDIAVSPRATFYASPMKILEYMAMGVPTVAPDMPNIVDIVEAGTTGVLFQPEDDRDLERAITELLDDDVSAKRLGRRARLEIEAKYNWQHNARTVIAVAQSKLQRACNV